MDSRHAMNLEGDRLSMLPDDIIHKILSFISIKNAIQTSALSSRWRFIWTSMPHLNISDVSDLSEFVNNVLSHRNNQIELYSVNLCFRYSHDVLLKTILDYAFSHHVQQLTVACLFHRTEEISFPIHLFSSQTLKYLRLSGTVRSCHAYSIVLASTWDLPALTTLHLDRVTFCDDKGTDCFSKCANLRNLTIRRFSTRGSCHFSVCHPRLSNLTLEYGHWTLNAVNVVAPHLENLTITSIHSRILITAPNLASLFFSTSYPLQFSTDLPCLEKVDLCIHSTDRWLTDSITALLQRLHNVKFLTLNLELVEPFASYMEQISHQPSPFSNLKNLKIHPVYLPPDYEAHKRVNLSTEVINYLQDGSPSATFTMISYQDLKEKQQKAQAFENALAAQNLMEKLQVMLEKEKAGIETYMDRGKTPMESHEADTHDQGRLPVEHLKRKMAQMKSCWEGVGSQIDRGREKTCDIISKLHDIEVLLLNDLPTSKRDKLHACFSGLRAEVDTVVKKILHHMQIHLSDCFNELASPSSVSF